MASSSFSIRSYVILVTISAMILVATPTVIETMELALSSTDDGLLTTFLHIVSIDIKSPKIQVCCKNQYSIFQKAYYFLSNPFFQVYDYKCKERNINGLVTDEAKISNLGLVPISFDQNEYPECSKGVLGLNSQAYFLSLLPVNLRSYTIFQNPSEQKKYTIKFGQDRTAIKEYAYFETPKNFPWAISLENVKYNQVLLGNYTLLLNSDSNTILLPAKIYEFVYHQLITVFECKWIRQQLLCPCETGLTDSYPAFIFMLNGNFSLEIEPDSYMFQDSEMCVILIKESPNDYIEGSILSFQDYIFKFEPLKQRIGILKGLNDQNNHEKIKLPLQLILNCLVILLLCIFLALVLIEIIKRVSGLAQARDEVFRVDVRNKNDHHYAND